MQYRFRWKESWQAWNFLDLVFQGSNTFNQVNLSLFWVRAVSCLKNMASTTGEASLPAQASSTNSCVMKPEWDPEHPVLVRKTQIVVTVSLQIHQNKGPEPWFSHLGNYPRPEFRAWKADPQKKQTKNPKPVTSQAALVFVVCYLFGLVEWVKRFWFFNSKCFITWPHADNHCHLCYCVSSSFPH